MLTDTSKKYLITGCTDAKGSSQYNMELSQKRADAVVNALIKKGVPNKMLKAKGVAQKYLMHLRMLPTKYEKEIVKL